MKDKQPRRRKPVRSRPNRMVTLDAKIVDDAMRLAARQRPPIDSLSRLIDVALVQWIDRNRTRQPPAA